MRVLFVDDDAMNRRVVRDMLVVAGVSVDEAHDGPTGLGMVDQGDYALVLMDLRMPGMDGLEAIQCLRSRGDTKGDLPIIVLTADTSADIRERCRSCGADDFLMKPVAMKPLFRAMAKAIAVRSQGHRQAAAI